MTRYRRLVNLVVLLCVAWQCSLLDLSGAQSSSPAAAARSSCPAGKEPLYNVDHPKDRGGMNSLLRVAKSSREAIYNNELPYEAISMEINKVYNNSVLRTSPFVNLWVSQSLNALLLAGFVLVVGLLLPALMVGMWLFWECCYEVDEEEEEENRNLYQRAQIIAWSLSVTLLLALLLLTVFLVILLVANSWVSSGVSKGGGVIETVLPELVRLRDQSLQHVSNVTRNDLCTLRRDLNTTVLSRVSSTVVSLVNSSFFLRVEQLYSNISRELSLRERIATMTATLLDHLSELQGASSNSSTLGQILMNVNSSIIDVISRCSMLSNLSGSGLDELCKELSSNQERYLPHIGRGVAGLEGERSLLLQLNELVTASPFAQPDNFNSFNEFLAQLAHNLTVHVNISSELYFGTASSLEQRLASFNMDVQRYSALLSFGWPHSQEQLDVYLGDRYLKNWDMFRSVCTVTFVFITILLGVCLFVAMVMGIWHIFTIYKCGEEEVNIEGAHQAGTMMKKLAFGFTGICAVSAIFYGVFICVTGVLDQGCGRHGNFTNLMQYVIDNNQTWGATYPLGTAIFENASYPLTVGKVLDGCRRNQSLFTVLHLEDRYNLNDIIDIPASEGSHYFDMMRSIAESLGVLSLYPSSDKLRLLANASTVPVNWSEFITLTRDDLFQEGFVGLAHLQELLDNMTSAASSHSLSSSNLSQIEIDNFTSLTESASRNTSVLADYIDHTLLPDVVSTATSLRDDQPRLTSTQLLSEIADIEMDLVSVVPMKSREQLHVAATNVIDSLSNFTSSAKDVLLCETGFCHSLSDKYDQFSSAVCNDVVQGMDVYWMTLIIILSLSLFVVLISLILASRFIDLELEKSNRNSRFHLTSAVIRQIRAMFWFVLSSIVNVWLIVVISKDEYFHQFYCRGQPPGCCPKCVWGFGILFLILSIGLGGGGRVYQCVVLHRINKFEAMKVRRYWMDRKKATQFYTQLIHFIQDVLFLIIAGSYVSGIGTLNIPSFFSISLSIIGTISYPIYLYLERSYVLTYFQWLKTEAHKRIKLNRQGAEPPTGGSGPASGGQSTMMNGRRPGGHYGSSESEQSEDDSQGTTQRDADWMYNSNHLPPSAVVEHIPLPVIHERSESMDPAGADELETASSAPPPPPPSSHHNGVLPMVGGARHIRGHPRQVELEHDSENELSQVQPNMNTMPLDNLNHGDYTASQIRLHRQQLRGGDLSSRHTEYAASTASYYSSSNSLTAASEMQQGYCSSSQAPDDHYDSSDYRDDYDSDYSHGYSQRYINRRYLPKLSGLPGEMSVEV